MKKLPVQAFLMTIAIIGVTGFQLFWLKQTYTQEKKSLTIRTNLAFRDAIQQLQVSKLKLDSIPGDTSGKKLKIFTSGKMDEEFNVELNEKKGVVSTINIIRQRVNDSFESNGLRKGILITKNHRYLNSDPVDESRIDPQSPPNKIIRLLYGVDSVQEPIKVTEVTLALKKKLEHQQVDIPFTITKLESRYEPNEQNLNEISVGFARPATYRLTVGNTIPFLLKRITLPIVFSFLLLFITVFSFILLYRNLLKQRRLTEIKNDFIGNITHELKTPISTVSVAIEAMKNFNALNDPIRAQEYLDISSNELQRLSLLVDKVLSFSKYQRNEIDIKKEKFDLLQLIKDVLESLKPQFVKQHAVITVQPMGSNFIIEADPRHMSSVVYNLLDNALKYSDNDPKITIDLVDRSKYLELRITDKGIGIPEEYKQKIFGQFFRVPHGDKHNIKGYGLGLSYVNHIVKSHHGFIEVESELGKGSTFIVKLPFREAPVIYYDKGRTIKKDFKL
ncbi:MAG: HAMP domain-containing sensor histidine kinase [Ferruginibacter sp.]